MREQQLEMYKDPIPLEDDPCDIIAKAMHGLEMSEQQLAEQAGISLSTLHRALSGNHDDATLKKIAPALGLSDTALTALSCYHPDIRPPAGLYRFTTAFGHAGVNAYVIVVGSKALVFDTGTDATPITQFIAERDLEIDRIFITHDHHDHTAGLEAFAKSPILLPAHCNHGDVLNIDDNHRLVSLDVSGHLKPARAYFYEGLSQPVCIVGDSVFAGSMGKTANRKDYRLAMDTARNNLLSLPADTVLCPGHGPLTTIYQETIRNPFLNAV